VRAETGDENHRARTVHKKKIQQSAKNASIRELLRGIGVKVPKFVEKSDEGRSGLPQEIVSSRKTHRLERASFKLTTKSPELQNDRINGGEHTTKEESCTG